MCLWCSATERNQLQMHSPTYCKCCSLQRTFVFIFYILISCWIGECISPLVLCSQLVICDVTISYIYVRIQLFWLQWVPWACFLLLHRNWSCMHMYINQLISIEVQQANESGYMSLIIFSRVFLLLCCVYINIIGASFWLVAVNIKLLFKLNANNIISRLVASR